MTEITMGGAKRDALERSQTPGRWWAALPGVLFVAAYLAGFLLVNPPNYDAPDKTWVDYFADRGHQVELLISAFVLSIAGLLMLTFLARLHDRVEATRDGAPRSSLPVGAAAAAGALIAAGGIVPAAVPANAIFQSLRIPSADILRLTSAVGYPLTAIGGMAAVGLAIAAITLQAQRSGYFGRVLSTFSYVAAGAAAAAFFFIPVAVVLLWVLVVSVVLARRPAAVQWGASSAPVHS